MTGVYDATDWRTFFSIRLRELGRLRRDVATAVERSEGWLSTVLSGRRLDPEVVPAMCRALDLDAAATEYFEALADLENGSPRAVRAAWAVVAAVQRQRASATVRAEEVRVLSKWYVVALLELARCEGFRPEAAWIARHLSPAISVEEATEAMTALLRLGLVAPDDTGRFVPRTEVWTPSELPPGEISLACAELYDATLAHAQAALRGARKNERHISGVTVAISEEHYARMVARLRDLERELVVLADADPGVRNRVYHLGIQWFPMSDYADADAEPDAEPAGLAGSLTR
jgi:uncharacterized protein (TIGR02147 family)